MLGLVILLPICVTSFSLLYVCCRGIYNIFFHPLRHYPGPVWLKATGIAYTYQSFRGNGSHFVKKLHEQYGEVVRLSPNQLSYTCSEAWTDAYGFGISEQRGNFPKDPDFYVKPPSGVDTLITSNEADHRRMRRLQAHAFSEKALSMQEGILTQCVDLFILRLHEQSKLSDGVLDIVKWFNFTTFDILGELAFGDSFKCLERGILHPWIKNIFQSIKATSFIREANFYPSPIKEIMRMLVPKNLTKSRNESFDFAALKARERLEQGTDRPDFTSYILRHNDEKGMTTAEIEVGAALLIIAGSETTATLLSGVTFHLLRNRHILDKLTKIIRDTFANESDMTLLNLQHVDYLHAVLDEGLRMYPPVPTALLRRTPACGGMVNGKYVPPFTKVGVNQWAAYRMESNFAEPNKFIPERWMKDPPAKFANDNKKVMQPFSVGPRNCLGKNLAYAEMRMILARLLWSFDLELQADSLNWDQQRIYLLWEKGSLNVKLTPREV